MVDTNNISKENIPGVAAQTPTADDYTQQTMDAYKSILDKYGTTTGGANASVIRSLNQGIQSKNQEYKKNNASVENMYGQLTQESDAAKTSLLGAYESAISGGKETTSALQRTLSGEIAAQEARRNTLASELGLSPENALTGYSSDARLNQAMTEVLGSGQSWENLLQSQKLSAQQQADRMRTAIGNTKASTKLALTEAYQNAINNYKSQIAQEKSRTGTTTLSPIGQIQADALMKQYSGLFASPESPKWQQDTSNKFAEFSNLIGKNVAADYNSPEFKTMLLKAQNYYKSPLRGAADPQVTEFVRIFGLLPYLQPNTGALYGQ